MSGPQRGEMKGDCKYTGELVQEVAVKERIPEIAGLEHSQVAPRVVTFRAEEMELPDKPGLCPAVQGSLSFLLCQREWPGCLLHSPDAGRGLGASRSPQGNICTFQTHVVSGGGECQAPAQHSYPGAGRLAGNRA